MPCVYSAKNLGPQNGKEQIEKTQELENQKTLKHFLLALQRWFVIVGKYIFHVHAQS
jgi:hypothetical protein